MKYCIAILCIVFIGFSCSRNRSVQKNISTSSQASSLIHKNRSKDSDSENIKVEQIYKNKERELLIKYPDFLLRNNDSTIAIKLINGDTIIIRDKNLEDNLTLSHILVDYLEPTFGAVIDAAYYEGEYWLHISRKTGKIDTLFSEPIFNPSQTMLLCASRDIEAGFLANGIQIWSIKEGELKLLYKLEETWGPDSVKWISDSLITFYRVKLGSTSDYNLRPDSLLNNRGKWHTALPINPNENNVDSM
jgi:hypothetical protein